ncbi:phage holin family protein [Cryobacterium sp. TMT1-62]|uniref:Phage holin family protein n=1 Tax=Cryobacterium sandaracinum TaxID=1259247 RepID=A0ABY2J2S9_9MICO|nr:MULTISPECIES: phage holin family protein [Cryobacterium]TFB55496.1 phage holin family protein [Cryobacterium sp. Sr3]TFB57479.1 phage holin family protein [Cryobacterium sp. Hz7]TFC31524.1 phage holin family protein [Cryobacterium sp. TMT2-18-2]TFC34481.1 phage holin family protein [Cryobacterium sp. TMT2-14]TFC37877.1 phage holin family protein [Cryobacterium sp. TMT2-42-4]
MARFLIKLILNSVALWLTTLLVSGVRVDPFAEGTTALIATYLLVALVFGLVNSVIGGFVRVVAFPVYILTLGLISLIVNGFLLMIVAWFSGLVGFGLVVDDFWWGVLGALVLGIISWILGVLIRPVTPRS